MRAAGGLVTTAVCAGAATDCRARAPAARFGTDATRGRGVWCCIGPGRRLLRPLSPYTCRAPQARLGRQEDFADFVNSNESFWTLEDGVLHLTLCKGSKGVTWPSLLKGHAPVDPFTQQEVQKSLMLERFQTENPGFDFSGASFNGQVPDPKTFMEGVRYT